MNEHTFNIGDVQDKPVYTLTCREFCALVQYANEKQNTNLTLPPAKAIGIPQLADALACSPAQISIMRREGVLDSSVISRVGRKIVFNVEKARDAANSWKREKARP